MQNLPGEVPGFYSMATITITDEQVTSATNIELFKLDKNNYIPVIITDVDTSVSSSDTIVFEGGLNVSDIILPQIISTQVPRYFMTGGTKSNHSYTLINNDLISMKVNSTQSRWLQILYTLNPHGETEDQYSNYINYYTVDSNYRPTDGFTIMIYAIHDTINDVKYIYNIASAGEFYNNSIEVKLTTPDLDASLKGYIPTNASVNYACGFTTSQHPLSSWYNISQFIFNYTIEFEINNPYTGGDSQTDPGDGSFDYTGDEIGIPDLPTVSVTDSGFVTLYAPTTAQLNSLASFMWSDAFSLDSFKKLFNNPMDCILGLSIIPVNVPTGGAREITVGNIVSTISCNVVTSQFIAVDCGTLTISPTKFTGGYLDYSPYTKAYIYLPFIGIQQLNIDDIMNSTLHVVYHVDILTGALVCYVQATNRTTGGVSQPDAVLYTYMGQCAESVPLSSSDFSSTMSSILSTAGAAAGLVATVATGGAAAPVAAAATGLAASTANTAMNMKPNISRSGAMGGSAGMMNIKYPFVIFDCPHTAIPVKQYEFTGFPSNKIVNLSSLSGFNVIQAINLSVAGATDQECDMIKSILTQGVII